MSDLDLDPTQLDRYSRHIIMDDVGPEGQEALLDAEVLVLGAGGLGAPVIQYLAAAGVGTLGIADIPLFWGLAELFAGPLLLSADQVEQGVPWVLLVVGALLQAPFAHVALQSRKR